MQNEQNQIIVAAKGLLLREGRSLLLRRSRGNPAGPGLWEFAGGTLEFGETLQQTLHREVHEETGLSVEAGPLLFADTGVVSAPYADPCRQVVIVCYLCAAPPGEVRLSREHDAFHWATKSEMLAMLDERILNELMRNKALEHPALLAAGLLE